MFCTSINEKEESGPDKLYLFSKSRAKQKVVIYIMVPLCKKTLRNHEKRDF